MSLVERAELLKKVIERMESKDAYNSFLRRAMGKAPYHTEIVPNEELSIESARYIQAKEYWAELCMDYFLAPEAMRMDSPEDFELIDGYVKRHDPLFDAAKAADLRDVTINGE